MVGCSPAFLVSVVSQYQLESANNVRFIFFFDVLLPFFFACRIAVIGFLVSVEYQI